MASHVFDLIDGFKVGGETHREVELREPSALDSVEAMEAAERPIATPDGWQLAISPSRLGLEIAMRQVVRIGTHPGPLTRAELKGLSAGDLSLLQTKAAELEAAAGAAGAKTASTASAEEGERRGRGAPVAG